MSARNPWTQPIAPRTVVVYRDAETAAVIGLVTFVFMLIAALVWSVVWLITRGTPLLAWLVVVGGRALHAAAAGRLLDAPAPAGAARPEAVRC
jgi:hypothetical protein